MELLVNNKKHNVAAKENETLLNVLREQLQLTGSKYGCGEGACGACTVIVDGTATRSCITKASSVVGKKIITIEGLAKDDRLHPMQQSCLDVDVFQCSYCASGMIMSAAGLLGKKSNPTEDEIIQSMQGNICRCGTYVRIVKAIQQAAKM
ncbi:MAG TPA: (2Fe-2S)-binding protein [Chryseolinea sp.]|nr:(2Fe-2S)-binding protein [Chryseolinea sp.]